MSAVEIVDVSRRAKLSKKMRGFSLENPHPGKADVFHIHVQGWALGSESPVTGVQVVHGTSVLRTIPLDYPSPEAALAHPDDEEAQRCGFNALVGVVGLPSEFELKVRAVLDNDSKTPLATIQGRRGPVPSACEPRLRPIMLTSLNRVGSTWMMGLFAAHPEIVVYRHYPYEYWSARYWAHVLKVLAEPANLVESATPGDFHTDLWHVGHNPFYNRHIHENGDLGEWFGRTYIERLATFYHQNMDDWYSAVARRQGQDDAIYFAEKHVAGHIPILMWDLYPNAKEVFLVRDFRDMVCSLMSFYNGKARSNSKSDEEYVSRLRGWAFRLYNDWKSREDRSYLVRYEDLASNPAETLMGVLEYLDLEASTEIVEGMLQKASEETPDLKGHRTTPNLEASIGRWRRELNPSVQQACEETFGELLGAFGYSS
jgi:hypothetical protein